MVAAKHSERGSAILFLFIAVALFGAVSWAMLGSSRTSLYMVQGEVKKVDPIAQGNCTNAVVLGVKRLTARGCPSLSFRMDGASTDTPDGSCSIYAPNGGGVAPCYAAAVDGYCEGNREDLKIGERCGGLFYIGMSAGHRVYTSANDTGKALWNNGNNNMIATMIRNAADGLANTNALIGLTDSGSPYQAAILCRSLGPQWYLPSSGELKLLVNIPSIQKTLIKDEWPTGTYWSSTENTPTRACGLSVPDAANCAGWFKNSVRNIRCVRR